MKAPKLSIIGFTCILLLVMFLPEAVSSQPGLDKEATTAIQNSDVASLALWFANGGDINRVTKHGNTLLMLASKIGDKPTLEYLFEQLPDVNTQNKAGATALMVAAKYGHDHVVDMLLDNGADPVIRNHSGITASRFAMAYGYPDIYSKLQKVTIEQYRRTSAEEIN